MIKVASESNYHPDTARPCQARQGSNEPRAILVPKLRMGEELLELVDDEKKSRKRWADQVIDSGLLLGRLSQRGLNGPID